MYTRTRTSHPACSPIRARMYIAEKLRDELFEMGPRRPDSGRSGFGLGFVRALTESSGGSVTVGESSDGRADFRVTLDRAA